MAVAVLDKHGRPLMPCSEKRARLLLERNRARVHRILPMVIRLVDRTVASCRFQQLGLKIDPGSKFTGLAVVRETLENTFVLNLFELIHRGKQISEKLTARRNMRRRRRSANLRYRQPRFLNRTKHKGWLAPSLWHRIETTMTWVRRLIRWMPIQHLSCESVRFDMQKLMNPEITAFGYQQGTLVGYEVREYLLEKWSRQCIYCDAKEVPLEIEHLTARSRGGSNRIGNLGIACHPCNLDKGARDVREYVKDPKRLKRILATATRPLKDAAAVNSTRWTLVRVLKTTELDLELASGGETKYNRIRQGIPKTHALDAVCVGLVGKVREWQRPTLTIKSMGRGSYQRTRLNAYGLPRGYLMSQKSAHGFQTGDHIKVTAPKGKHIGTHTGRVAVRISGSFNLQLTNNVLQGVSYRYCTLIQRNDGYRYSF